MGLGDFAKKAIGIGAGAAGLGKALGLFDDESELISQVPLTTPEQDQARRLLLGVGQTGRLGDFVFGQPADLSGFNFDVSPTEALAGEQLGQFGQPAGIGTARDVLTDFATQEFNPDDPSSGLGAFRRQLARQIGDADDVIDREAAITGSRFGSRIAGAKTDLAERQSDIIASRLSDQFNINEGRRLAAASGLSDLERLNEQINQSRIAQAFQLGGLQRDLNNQRAQLKLSDFLRQRNEQISRIAPLSTVATNNVPFGVKDLEVKTPSPFSQLLNAGLTAAGTAVGGPVGGAIGSTIGNFLNREQPQTSFI